MLLDPQGNGKDPVRPNARLTDNEPLAAYLREGFVAHFGDEGATGLSNCCMHPAGTSCTPVTALRHGMVPQHVGQVSLIWDALGAPFIVELLRQVATGKHEMFSLFVESPSVRATINGRAVAGRAFPREFAGKKTAAPRFWPSRDPGQPRLTPRHRSELAPTQNPGLRNMPTGCCPGIDRVCMGVLSAMLDCTIAPRYRKGRRSSDSALAPLFDIGGLQHHPVADRRGCRPCFGFDFCCARGRLDFLGWWRAEKSPSRGRIHPPRPRVAVRAGIPEPLPAD